MKPDPKEEHKEHSFDSYCKRTLKNESNDYRRRMNVLRKHEIPLSELPQDRLEIVLLHYFLGMSDPEIAAHLNLVRQTVAYRRTSSLQELKKFMEGKS